ncbi:uncharacterized protein LOC120634600 [Pararge aegeria]|uniref:uncharacterized protein LOC120634600 n=1 Tax=Pararge aegeria TaxID=116150 RepID=UPI0019D2EB86|nr:uncharacterized protein LOC120634600 [Pararge aegeria]
MFAPCLLLILFIATLNADESLRCDFTNGSFCGWSNDPQATEDNIWSASQYNFIKTSLYNVIEPARLLSPMYDRALEETGCFSLRFTMSVDQNLKFPTLRIYQRPEYIDLEKFIQYNEEAKKKYLLFEIKANLDKFFFNAVPSLGKFDDNFQIIIEGNSASYYAYLAIDNVAILQGTDCASAVSSARFPPSPPAYNVEEFYVHTTTAAPTS